jgi:hypothetical protein
MVVLFIRSCLPYVLWILLEIRTALSQLKKADELVSVWVSHTTVGAVPASWSTPATRTAIDIKQKYAIACEDSRFWRSAQPLLSSFDLQAVCIGVACLVH